MQKNHSFFFVPSLREFILGFQHLVAMFGATVLVPLLTGFDPSVALICAGCGTLIFHLCTKGKVPVFLGSSFAFIPLIVSVKTMYKGDLAYAQGGIVVAGVLYVIMSFLIVSIGVERINKYLPAQVVGPMIIVIGLNLVPVAFSMASGHFLIAGITLICALSISIFGKGFIKQLSILIGVLVGYILALSLNFVDINSILSSPFVSIPHFRMPKFSLNAIVTIAPVVIAVFMEHIGDIKTNGAVVGKDFISNPGLNRTLLGDGLATIFAGFIGGPANTTYGENTGVLAMTKNYDPKILRLAAVFAIFLGTIGKLGAVLASIPVPVMGGISLMLFSMIALVGLRTIKNSGVKLNGKNIVVMSSILLIGLGSSYIKSLTGFSLSIPLTNTVNLSGLSLAALVGIFLNAVLNFKHKEAVSNSENASASELNFKHL